MKKSTLIVLTIGLLIGALIFTGCSSAITNANNGEQLGNGEQKRGYDGENGNGYRGGEESPYLDVNNYPKEDLSESEIQAMTEALMDEYKARDFYTLVIEKFGDVNPFVNIKRAEEMHIDSLKKLFEKYGLQIPEDTMMDEAKELMKNVNEIKDACEIGVQAEIENGEIYERLFEMVDNQDIEAVFTSLRDASINNHLKAFEKCAESTMGRGGYGKGESDKNCGCDEEHNEGGKGYRRGRD